MSAVRRAAALPLLRGSEPRWIPGSVLRNRVRENRRAVPGQVAQRIPQRESGGTGRVTGVRRKRRWAGHVSGRALGGRAGGADI